MDSEAIGQQVEDQLLELLISLGFVNNTSISNSSKTPVTEIISEDLRLMNRGEQYGLDLSWVVHFSDNGKKFNWYFEAKGHGFIDYLRKKRSKHKPFHINLIAEKLLKALTLHTKDIHCWCLFAPYISCDEADLIELSKLSEYLPFKLIIWDKNFLYSKLSSLNADLFSTIYPKEKNIPQPSPENMNQVRELIKTSSYEGNFWNSIQKRYFSLRRNIVSQCKKDLIFDSVVHSLKSVDSPIPRKFETKYILIYEQDDYEITHSELSGATSIEGIKRLFSGAKNSQNESLSSKFKDFLIDEDNPYLQIILKHRSGEFKNKIPFYEINSSTNFGCTFDKPVFIKIEE